MIVANSLAAMSSALRAAARAVRRLPTSRMVKFRPKAPTSSAFSRRSYAATSALHCDKAKGGGGGAAADADAANGDDNDGGIVFASYGTDGVGRSNVGEEDGASGGSGPAAAGDEAPGKSAAAQDDGAKESPASAKQNKRGPNGNGGPNGSGGKRGGNNKNNNNNNNKRSDRSSLLRRVNNLKQQERFQDALSALEDEHAGGSPVRAEDFKGIAIAISQHRNDAKRRRGGGGPRAGSQAQHCRIDDVIEA